MTNNNEISTTYLPEIIVDNTLFALDFSGGLVFRITGSPVSAAEKERCITAISMLFISFEGYFNRIIYLLINDSFTLSKYDTLKDEPNTATRLKGLLDDTKISQKLVERFKESLVIRNAIAHGHLYETKRNVHRRFSVINKIVLDDNNRNYRTYVNQKTFRTNNLRLHIVPSEIGISDLYQILKLWNAIYNRMIKLHKNIAWLQGYIFPDYTAYLKVNGRDSEIDPLEQKLIGYDDGSFSQLLSLIDGRYRY